jgi:hypothetical protein
VAKDHAQQCGHKRTLAVNKLLRGFSLHHVESSTSFRFLPTEEWIVSEDSDAVLLSLLKKQWSYNSTSRYCILQWIQWSFFQCLWVFGIAQSVVYIYLLKYHRNTTGRRKESVQDTNISTHKAMKSTAYWIPPAVSRCYKWFTSWSRYGCNFSCLVARLPLSEIINCPESVFSKISVAMALCFLNAASNQCNLHSSVRVWGVLGSITREGPASDFLYHSRRLFGGCILKGTIYRNIFVLLHVIRDTHILCFGRFE